MSGIPTQDACDLSKPEQALLWASMYIPTAGTGRQPYVFPRMMAEDFSVHYTECGFFHVDYIRSLADADGVIRVEDLPEQKKKLVRPYRGQQHALNPLGWWAPMDTPEEPAVVIQDPVAMTSHEREAQVERLRYMGYRINEPVPGPETGHVVDPLDDPPGYDPESNSVTEVNAFLRECEDRTEYIRIVRAEKRGRARQGILKRHHD